MNDKLKNYVDTPDPEVWERIQKTMHRKALRRQAWTVVAGASIVAVAIVAVVLWPNNSSVVSQQPTITQVAQAEAPQVNIGVDNQTASMTNEEAHAQQKAVPSVTAKETRSDLAGSVVASSNAEPALSEPTVQPIVAQVTSSSVKPNVEVKAPSSEISAVSVAQEDEGSSNVADVEKAKPQVKAVSGNAMDDTILWVPNIFVPSSDDEEINLFRVRLNHPDYVVSNFRMTIFNRTGNQVFMSNDINTPWDGKYRGREMPQSAYVYVIYYTDKDGLRHQRKGTITLVR